ncbi:MAG: hypothetical protein JNG89_16155 [Planctomycetaceae bacterium]|nr:hypothetical protein [Planctomycetaceae bacterium]
MSVGFAGARGLDDRRRRRLAQNAESAERRPPARPAAPATATPQFAASPIESVVRPQVWANVLLVLLGLSVCGGSIYLGEWVDRHYPTASASLGARGLLVRAIDACLFLFAAQLAAAIHWYRARSRKDFNARYRIWHFVVPGLLAFGFCAATDTHLVLADWAQARWHLAGEHASMLLWMAPAGVVLLAMARLLQTEMRGTSGAAPCLWIATLAGIANAAVLLKAPAPLDDATLSIIGRSAMLLWPLGLLLSLLFYARSVIYVTNEPSALPNPAVGGPEETGRNWLNWWRPRQKSERETVSEAKAAMSELAAKSKPASVPEKTGDEKTSAADDKNDRKTMAVAPKAAPKPSVQAPVTPAEPEEMEPADVSGTVYRADHSHDEDDEDDHRHRHMSKKDRKKLRRMQQREDREMYE